MRTIGRRWPSTAPRGDRQAMCTRCGVQWRRSQLRRDMDGGLSCPDEGEGRDAVELSLANAEASRDWNSRVPVDYEEGGVMVQNKTEPTPDQDLANTLNLDAFGAKVTFG